MFFARLPELCLRLGILYLLIGMCLGAFMGMKEDFAFRDVHAHINLMGYVMTFLMGLFLKAYPSAVKSRVTRAAAVLLIIAVPVTLVALTIFTFGHVKVAPLLGFASILVVFGNALFAVSIFRATA